DLELVLSVGEVAMYHRRGVQAHRLHGDPRGEGYRVALVSLQGRAEEHHGRAWVCNVRSHLRQRRRRLVAAAARSRDGRAEADTQCEQGSEVARADAHGTPCAVGGRPESAGSGPAIERTAAIHELPSGKTRTHGEAQSLTEHVSGQTTFLGMAEFPQVEGLGWSPGWSPPHPASVSCVSRDTSPLPVEPGRAPRTKCDAPDGPLVLTLPLRCGLRVGGETVGDERELR